MQYQCFQDQVAKYCNFPTQPTTFVVTPDTSTLPPWLCISVAVTAVTDTVESVH